MDAPAGVEPTLTESKSGVLPLDEGAVYQPTTKIAYSL
jgi:hypothetical protein